VFLQRVLLGFGVSCHSVSEVTAACRVCQVLEELNFFCVSFSVERATLFRVVSFVSDTTRVSSAAVQHVTWSGLRPSRFRVQSLQVLHEKRTEAYP
jgi:hypothetical protein